MDELYLVEPTLELKDKANEYRQSFVDAGENHINGSFNMMRFKSYEEWLDTVNKAHYKETSINGVASISYFCIRKKDQKIVGTVQLRYDLDEKWKFHGGNIGCGIRPDERRKGYGRQQLSLVLKEAKKIGLKQVMITCNQDNVASKKTIEDNGGKLVRKDYLEEIGWFYVFIIDC